MQKLKSPWPLTGGEIDHRRGLKLKINSNFVASVVPSSGIIMTIYNTTFGSCKMSQLVGRMSGKNTVDFWPHCIYAEVEILAASNWRLIVDKTLIGVNNGD